MFNNVAIDVTIGLIFVFLTYSLLAAIVQEIIARWFGLRARILVRALRRMLEDGDKKTTFTFIAFFRDIANNFRYYFQPIKPDTLLHEFYKYPLVKYLGENYSSSKPSYINAAQFSDTMISLLSGEFAGNIHNQMAIIGDNLTSNRIGNFTINSETLRYLKKMWRDANNDLSKFKNLLEEWFNATMERATGWYKRQTQFLLFLTGLFMASQFNVDAIAIGKILARDKDAREQMVRLAISRQEKYTSAVEEIGKNDQLLPGKDGNTPDTLVKYSVISDSALLKLQQELQSDGQVVQSILGLGGCPEKVTDSVCVMKVQTELQKMLSRKNITLSDLEKLHYQLNACTTCTEGRFAAYQNNQAAKYAGWLITALAISLGAPFWFDLLNRFMKVRGAGARPADDKAPENEASVPASKNRVG